MKLFEKAGDKTSPFPSRRYWLLVAVGWFGLLLFITVTVYLAGFRPLALIMEIVAGKFLPVALMTPAVFLMAQYYPINLSAGRTNLGKHLVAAAGFGLICGTLSCATLVALQPNIAAAFKQQLARAFPEAARDGHEFDQSAMIFLPLELRSAKFDGHTVLVNATTNLPPYGVLLLFAHAYFATVRLRAQEQQAAELAAHLAEAHLAGLRTQLQPHFLFNTLNSIAALIPQNARLANEMVLNLADLLRMTLRDPQRGEIALGEELKLLGHYVDIQKLRFGERLVCQREVPADCLPFLVPTLLLQPLVENAIRHGVEPSDQPEQITVRARLAGSMLVLEVTNTRCGAGEEMALGTPGTGVGLANTRDRLAALYGSAHSFHAGPQAGGGFHVEIHIPQRSV